MYSNLPKVSRLEGKKTNHKTPIHDCRNRNVCPTEYIVLLIHNYKIEYLGSYYFLPNYAVLENWVGKCLVTSFLHKLASRLLLLSSRHCDSYLVANLQ
jgi:hypothetical protein